MQFILLNFREAVGMKQEHNHIGVYLIHMWAADNTFVADNLVLTTGLTLSKVEYMNVLWDMTGSAVSPLHLAEPSTQIPVLLLSLVR